MVPSYLALLENHHPKQPPAAAQQVPTGLLDLTRVSRETAMLLKDGKWLAVKNSVITTRKAVLDANGQLNRSTRQMGRTTKMCHIPRAAFTEETWRDSNIPTSSPPTSYPPSRTTSPPSGTTSPLTRTTSPLTRTTSPPSRTTLAPSRTTSPPSRTTSPSSRTPSPPSRTTSPPSRTTLPPSRTTSPSTRTTSPPTITTSPPTRTTSPKPQQQSARTQTKRPVPTPRKISEQIGILTPSRVSNMEDVCMTCLKVGGKMENWVECETCQKWFHTRCMHVSAKQFKEIKTI